MKNEEISLNTKRILASELRSLMERKPFSKITVSEIVEACGINRKTFYYHFADVYELLRWMLEEETVKIVRQIDLNNDYPKAVRFVLDYVDSNAHILNCALDSAAGYSLHRFFVNDFMKISLSVIQKAEAKYAVTLSEERRAFLAEFYSEAVAGILHTWIRNRKKPGAVLEEEYIGEMIRSSLVGVLTAEKDKETKE